VNIVLCTNHFPPFIGGCETVTSKLVNYLAERGHNVYVATRRSRSRNPRNFPSIHFIEYLVGRYQEFETSLNKVKPDLIFIYSDVFDFTRQVFRYKNLKRLILAPCGANWFYANKNYVNNVLYRHSNKLDRIICHSKHNPDYKLCSVDRLKNKTVVIPNGVDLDEFKNNTLSRNDLLPNMADKPWLLNVSNFFPGKGQHHLVDILNMLPQKKEFVYIQVFSDIEFPIGAQIEGKWEKLCKMNLNKNIHFVKIKNASREKVVGYFNNSNMFVFPTEKEVAPIVLLEAMAAGIPWVAADVGNTQDLKGGRAISAIRDSRYHSVIDKRVKTLFAKSIKEMYNKPSLGEQGRQQIIDELNWEKILPQYASIIEKNA